MVILDRMNQNMECKLHRILMFTILQQINRNDHAIHLKLPRDYVTANRTTHNFLFIKSRTIYIMPKRCYLLSFVFSSLLLPFIVTLKHGNCLHCPANMQFFPSVLLNYICMLFRSATRRLFKPKRLNSCDKQFSKTSWHLTSIHQIVSCASSMWKEQRMTKKNCLSFYLANALKELSKGILLLPLMEWMNERL